MSLPASGSIGAVLTQIKAGPARIGAYHFSNSNAAMCYCQVFDALAASVTLGTTAPLLSFAIPGSSAINAVWGADRNPGYIFQKGIVIAMTTTRAGATSPAATVDYNLSCE
jgi:hypothetical protein